jgi:hypothetical protein
MKVLHYRGCLHLRFTLSFKAFLAERGITVCHVTIPYAA